MGTGKNAGLEVCACLWLICACLWLIACTVVLFILDKEVFCHKTGQGFVEGWNGREAGRTMLEFCEGLLMAHSATVLQPCASTKSFSDLK